MVQETAESLGKILVVDDDTAVAETHAFLIREFGYEAFVQTDSGKALADLSDHPDIDLILLDIRMPGIDGMEFLKQIKSLRPDIGVIMVTVVDDTHQAVTAVKMGAYDYLDKPVSPEQFKKALDSYFSSHPKRLAKDPRFASFVTRNRFLTDEIFPRISVFSEKDVTVLIEGETGVGKELMAQLIYSLSHRRHERFVPVNVSAINLSLFDAELFGYRRGAFTSAIRDHDGFFESAGKGTIFLDEIGDLDHGQQQKLLRILDTHKYCRVGETIERTLHARILMATNRDLYRDVQAKHFREDLYHRIACHRIVLPPLRERTEDIELLANHFLRKYCSRYKTALKKLSPETLKILTRYPYPGNVRELEGVIKTSILDEQDLIIHPSALPPKVVNIERGGSEYDLGKMRCQKVLEVLVESNGNRSKTAQKLGISRGTLRRIIKKSEEIPSESCLSDQKPAKDGSK